MFLGYLAQKSDGPNIKEPSQHHTHPWPLYQIPKRVLHNQTVPQYSMTPPLVTRHNPFLSLYAFLKLPCVFVSHERSEDSMWQPHHSPKLDQPLKPAFTLSLSLCNCNPPFPFLRRWDRGPRENHFSLSLGVQFHSSLQIHSPIFFFSNSQKGPTFYIFIFIFWGWTTKTLDTIDLGVFSIAAEEQRKKRFWAQPNSIWRV